MRSVGTKLAIDGMLRNCGYYYNFLKLIMSHNTK